jgi:hypothetical protein
MRYGLTCTIATVLALGGCNLDDTSTTGKPPQLTTRPGGAVEVAFDSGCTVLFGPKGKLLNAGSSCSGSQRDRARDAFRAHRAEQDPSTYGDV